MGRTTRRWPRAQCGLMACAVMLGAGGCSLVFGGGDYQGGVSVDDGGRADAELDANGGGDDASTGCVGTACTVRPSFVGDPSDALTGTADVVIKSGEQATWNLETGVLSHGGEAADETVAPKTEAQDADAPELTVFAVNTLTVQKNASLSFTGTGRAVSILAVGDVLIEGTIDVSAAGEKGGPGGASSALDDGLAGLWPSTGGPGMFATGPSGNQAAVVMSGGGGGSNGAKGGAGGGGTAAAVLVTATATGAAPGVSSAELWPGSLFGGGAGGIAFCAGWPDVRGGGGGGALHVVSQGRIRVSSLGRILASGAGGRSRDEAFAASSERCHLGIAGGGGGGGAGGTVVLEASTVAVAGGLFANGGGGAGGDTGNAGPLPGADGRANGTRAPGSNANVAGNARTQASDGGDGGAGAAADGTPGAAASAMYTNPFDPDPPLALTGGGGGGAGRIVIRTRTGTLDDNGGKFSPAGELLVVEKVTTFTPD